jgi:hypothetical protein
VQGDPCELPGHDGGARALGDLDEHVALASGTFEGASHRPSVRLGNAQAAR